jgi:hypothetical protein
MSNDKPKNLYQKLALIMGALHKLKKGGVNQHFKYTFLREVDVAETMRPLLAEHNIVVVPSIISCVRESDFTTICVRYTIINADAPNEQLTSDVFATSKDAQDKGVYKASTNAAKYFFVRLLCIGSDDDVENEEPLPKPVKAARVVKTAAASNATFYYTTDKLAAERILEAAEYLEKFNVYRIRAGLYSSRVKIPKADELLCQPSEEELRAAIDNDLPGRTA